MFKVIASTIEDYFAFDPARTSDLRKVDRTIRKGAPSLKRWFAPGAAEGRPGMKMAMIGYGHFAYVVQASPEPIKWPIVGSRCKRII